MIEWFSTQRQMSWLLIFVLSKFTFRNLACACVVCWGLRARESKNEEASLFFKKELFLYLLCFFSSLNNITTFGKFSIQQYATPPKPIFGPIDPNMVWPVSYFLKWKKKVKKMQSLDHTNYVKKERTMK